MSGEACSTGVDEAMQKLTISEESKRGLGRRVRGPDELHYGRNNDDVLSFLECTDPIHRTTDMGASIELRFCECLDAFVCGDVGASVVMKTATGPRVLSVLNDTLQFNARVRPSAEEHWPHDFLVLYEYPVYVASTRTVFMFAERMAEDVFNNSTFVRSQWRLTPEQVEFQVACVVRDMLHGLMILHRAGIVHGDVKPENVVLAEGPLYPDTGAYPAQGVPHLARLIDFDGSGVVQRGRANIRTCTKGYVGPREQRTSLGGVLRVTPAHDVFSLGRTAYTMYRLLTHDDVSSAPMAGASEEFLDFLWRCVHVDPIRRPTLDALLGGPFIGRYIAPRTESGSIALLRAPEAGEGVSFGSAGAIGDEVIGRAADVLCTSATFVLATSIMGVLLKKRSRGASRERLREG